ncbi:hypothetical protein ACIBKY_52670 [Nonomuraea sp. NPDC050394]|uniref:hypothetical protein n=1 Tax=Nonomuraea sp. NPDC050394 TaxID=3364363 RepID=UPI0037A42306
MFRGLLAVAALSAMFVLPAEAAMACSCATGTPRELAGEATAVFTGTATGVRVIEPMENGGKVIATLRADHFYKGDARPSVEVTTRAQGPACGFAFHEGARYLLFARTTDAGLATSLCSGNLVLPAGDQPMRVMERTEGMGPVTPELLAVLGTPTRVRPESSSIHVPAGAWPGWILPAAIVVVIALVIALLGAVWVRRRTMIG